MAKTLNHKKLVTAIIEKRFDMQYKRKKNIGLRELANKIGISFATLSRVMSGRKMDLDTFLRICYWINKDIDINYFING